MSFTTKRFSDPSLIDAWLAELLTTNPSSDISIVGYILHSNGILITVKITPHS